MSIRFIKLACLLKPWGPFFLCTIWPVTPPESSTLTFTISLNISYNTLQYILFNVFSLYRRRSWARVRWHHLPLQTCCLFSWLGVEQIISSGNKMRCFSFHCTLCPLHGSPWSVLLGSFHLCYKLSLIQEILSSEKHNHLCVVCTLSVTALPSHPLSRQDTSEWYFI